MTSYSQLFSGGGAGGAEGTTSCSSATSPRKGRESQEHFYTQKYFLRIKYNQFILVLY